MSKLVIVVALQLLVVGAVPHAKKHVKFSDSGSGWDSDKSRSSLESPQAEGIRNTTSEESYSVSVEKEKACSLEVLWYYAFPVLVYFLLIVLAVLLALGVINLCLCLRRGCPPLPCDVSFCHKTTVLEEKNSDGRRKDKLQLALVNVNKHYYKLEGQDIP